MQLDQVVRSAPALVRGLLGSGPARPLVAGEAARAAVEADVHEDDDDLSPQVSPEVLRRDVPWEQVDEELAD